MDQSVFQKSVIVAKMATIFTWRFWWRCHLLNDLFDFVFFFIRENCTLSSFTPCLRFYIHVITCAFMSVWTIQSLFKMNYLKKIWLHFRSKLFGILHLCGFNPWCSLKREIMKISWKLKLSYTSICADRPIINIDGKHVIKIQAVSREGPGRWKPLLIYRI